MSADNFLALRQHEASDKYVVTHEFMSADELSDLDSEYTRLVSSGGAWLSGVFDTWLDASSFIDKCYEDEYSMIEYGPSICVEQPAWENNNIQFPRLIAEILATQEVIDVVALAQSMDLTIDDVEELFERAQVQWEAIKSGNTGATDTGTTG